MAVLVVTWSPVADAISYEFRYALYSPSPFYIYSSTLMTYINVPGLIDQETYVIGVRSVCSGGMVSDWSERIVVTCDSVSPCDMEGTAVATY